MERFRETTPDQLISQQSARIAVLEAQLEQASKAEAAIRLEERQKTEIAIAEAMLNGAHGIAKPDEASWLLQHWNFGAQTVNVAKDSDNWKRAYEQIASVFDGITEALLPTIEFVNANKERFGSAAGESVAPIINDFFMRAYRDELKAPAAPADDEDDGRELIQFNRAATNTSENGTVVRVYATADNGGFGIDLTSTGSTGKTHTQNLWIKAETLYVVLSALSSLIGKCICAEPGRVGFSPL